MRFFFFCLSMLLVFTEAVWAQALPVWSESDRARLKKGEIIVGADILVEDPDMVPLPKIAPEPEVPPLEPIEPEPEYDPKELPQEFLATYFSTSPESYLIDPQRLLSKQETLDREGFLDYHADDSEVDIRMYLFDAQQEIPAPYTLEKLVAERYAGGDLTAVVFYFLGDPSRNQLAFGGEGASGIGALDIRKMLESAQIKAMEKSDPTTQIESFIVQLSIRLYWLEKKHTDARAVAALEKAKSSEATQDAVSATGANTGPNGKSGGASATGSGSVWAKFSPYILYAIGGGMGVLLLSVGLLIAWRVWSRSRVYHFPVFEIPNRLEANYAAGVGAVLAFHNKLGSPSSQRDQVPDYLTRL